MSFSGTPQAISDFWELSGEVFDHWNSENTNIGVERMAEIALAVLQINHRIGPIEIAAFNAMGRNVFDSVRVYSLPLAIIDLQINEDLKKKLDQLR